MRTRPDRHRLTARFLATLTVGASLLLAGPARGQLPLRTQRVASGLSSPILALSPPGDDARLFLVEQGGKIVILRDGALLPDPFLDLRGLVSTGGEQGVMGAAFHPDYATNGLFYVGYTDVTGDTLVEQYEVSLEDPDLADPDSGTAIVGPIAQPSAIHNGGSLAFGPDGNLYVGMGDGGGPGTQNNAQDPGTLLGKMLRLDVDLPFPHVPPDNPFVGSEFVLDEIWAFGLREPWRFSFDRLTGDLYLGDVGAGGPEEVNVLASARLQDKINFGWPCMEGSSCTSFGSCTCGSPSLTLPVEEFDHTVGCAVIGGHVYRGQAVPALEGYYLYATFCYSGASRVFAFTHNGQGQGPTIELTDLLIPEGAPSLGLIHSFGEDGDGEIYFVERHGDVHRIVCDALADPSCGPGTAFCFGDSGCPCGNDAPTPNQGCLTSSGEGVILFGTGSSSVSADDLVLTVTGIPSPNANGIVFMGPGIVAPFVPDSADGLACTGGGLRFPGILDDNQPPNVLEQSDLVATAAANAVTIAPGETWHFQSWMRDTNGSPCGGLSNLSNGYTVTFTP